ncbi:MAG TPA: hypothetical protein VMK84_16370 [Streptosporangiaceae bacterium]|nr:hypothetical protein [Streptosporangiaceae bacterium]
MAGLIRGLALQCPARARMTAAVSGLLIRPGRVGAEAVQAGL